MAERMVSNEDLSEMFLKVRFLAKPKRASSLWSYGLTKSLDFIRPFLRSAEQASFLCSRLTKRLNKDTATISRWFSQLVSQLTGDEFAIKGLEALIHKERYL